MRFRSVSQAVSQSASEWDSLEFASQSVSQSLNQSVSLFGASAGLCEIHDFNEVVRRFVALPASWFLSKSWKFLEAPEDIFVKKNDGLQWHLEFPCWGTPPQNTPFGIYYVNLFQRHTRRFPLCADQFHTGFYRLKWHITPFSFICKLLFFVFAIQINPIFVDWTDNLALMMISLFPALRLALRGNFCSSSLLSWVSHSVSQPASQSVNQLVSQQYGESYSWAQLGQISNIFVESKTAVSGPQKEWITVRNWDFPCWGDLRFFQKLISTSLTIFKIYVLFCY